MESFLIILRDEMPTRTLEFEDERQKPSLPVSVISGGPYSPEFGEGYSWSMPTIIKPIHKQRWNLGGLGLWLLALTTITTPIVYADPQRELLRSGSSVVWSVRRRLGRQISLKQAYEIAMRIINDTDRRLTAERITEARFTLGPWEEQ
jgi:hypothetical protein